MSKKVSEFWQKYKRLLLTHLISLGVLLLGFLLCRYAFFDLHGMKEWPVDLFVAGILALLISLFARKQYAPWFTSVGYFLGFLAGALFHREGTDPGGGKTDNLWIIWTFTFLGCIVAGFLLEYVLKWRRMLRKK